MHFLLSIMSVVYVLTTSVSDDGGDNPTVEQVTKRAKWDNNDYVSRCLILNGMSDSLFDIYQNVEFSKELWDSLEGKYMAEDASSKKFLKDFKHTLKNLKEELTLVQLGSHLHIEESLGVQDNDKPKGNNVASPSVVNMVEHKNSSRYNDNKGKRKHHDNTRADPNKKAKPTCWKCGKTGHIKRDCKGVNVSNKANGSGTKGSVDGSSNSLTGATVYVCIDRCWFKTYKSLNDRSILHMGNESTALVHGHGCVSLRLNIITDNIGSAFMSTFKLNDSILCHARLGHVHFKRMQYMFKDGLILTFDMDIEKWNKRYFVTFIDDALRFCYLYLLHTKDEALDKFKVFKTEVELQQGSLNKRFRTDKGGLSQGFCGEAMLTACYLLNMVPNKRNMITPYQLWTKRKPNLNYLKVWSCRKVVRLPDPKLKTLGERGIECIFVGYAEHSNAFRFYVIEPNDSV
ncbi:zinc finger, CCHC-type containing protein [Tanacetum coccineum]